MAKQYCRYCAFLAEGDCYYCSEKEAVLSEAQIKHENKCQNYAYTDAGDIITGKQYLPRERKSKRSGENMEQIGIEVCDGTEC